MNDIRRTILWVIFGFSMISLWDQWQVYNGHNPTFGLAPTTKVAANKTTPAAANATPSATPSASASVPNATNPIAPQAINTPAAAQNGNANAVAAPELPEQRFEVTTDVLKLTFDTEGGSLVRSEFLKHADMDNKTKGVVLLDDSKDRVYMAQTGLIGAANLPTHKTVMAVAPGARNFEGNTKDLKELIVKFESPEAGGVKLVKTYTLKRDGYDIAVKHEVVNTSSAPVAPQLYLQILRDGNKLAGESSFYSTFTGPAVYTEAKKFQKIEFTDIDKNKVDAEKQASNGFVAMVQHYFASDWILPDGIKRDLFTRKEDTNL